jgi:hypothetical protein
LIGGESSKTHDNPKVYKKGKLAKRMEKERRYNNVDLSSRQKGGDNCINPLAKDE